MKSLNPQQNRGNIRKNFRKIHKIIGITLSFFILIVAISGILLGLKKHSGGLIYAKTIKGTSTNLKEWMPIDKLHNIACKILHDSVSPHLSLDLDRIDIRMDKGLVKFIFLDDFWAVHLDGATGNLLQIESRRSDFIEKIHDGSILDYYFNTNYEQFKLTLSTSIGLAVLILTITGFWIWYAPKRMKKTIKNRKLIKNRNIDNDLVL